MKCPGCGKEIGRFQTIEDKESNLQSVRCPRTGAKYLLTQPVVRSVTKGPKHWKHKKSRRRELEPTNG